MRQAQEDLGGDLAAGANRDVVDDDGEVRRGGERPEVGLDAGLRRTDVVRRHDEHGVHAGTLRLRREARGMRGVVGAAAGDERDVDRLAHGAPHRDLLFVGEHARLAGGAGEHQRIVALLHQPGRERGAAGEIDRAVVGEGRDHGGDDPPEPRHQPSPWVRRPPALGAPDGFTSGIHS